MTVSKENEEIPEIPIRQDITVITPDNGPRKLPFIYAEGEVALKDKDGFVPCNEKNIDHYEEIDLSDHNCENKPKVLKNRLKNFEDISDGDIVYSTWYDGSIIAMKVESLDKEKHSALGKIRDSVWGNLYFNNDFRKCWVCNGYMFINKDALSKVEFINTTEGN